MEQPDFTADDEAIIDAVWGRRAAEHSRRLERRRAAEGAVVLFEADADEGKLYLIGSDESDTVALYDAGQGTVMPDQSLAAVTAHMPYTEWREYAGDDEADILAGYRRAL